jgi:predicted nucleic acid-binding protein
VEKAKVICDTDVMIDFLDPYHPRHLATRQIIENTIGLNFLPFLPLQKWN